MPVTKVIEVIGSSDQSSGGDLTRVRLISTLPTAGGFARRSELTFPTFNGRSNYFLPSRRQRLFKRLRCLPEGSPLIARAIASSFHALD